MLIENRGGFAFNDITCTRRASAISNHGAFLSTDASLSVTNKQDKELMRAGRPPAAQALVLCDSWKGRCDDVYADPATIAAGRITEQAYRKWPTPSNSTIRDD